LLVCWFGAPRGAVGQLRQPRQHKGWIALHWIGPALDARREMIVKLLVGTELRRFSIPDDTSFHQFITMLHHDVFARVTLTEPIAVQVRHDVFFWFFFFFSRWVGLCRFCLVFCVLFLGFFWPGTMRCDAMNVEAPTLASIATHQPFRFV
jgi:hypothetical protein